MGFCPQNCPVNPSSPSQGPPGWAWGGVTGGIDLGNAGFRAPESLPHPRGRTRAGEWGGGSRVSLRGPQGPYPSRSAGSRGSCCTGTFQVPAWVPGASAPTSCWGTGAEGDGLSPVLMLGGGCFPNSPLQRWMNSPGALPWPPRTLIRSATPWWPPSRRVQVPARPARQQCSPTLKPGEACAASLLWKLAGRGPVPLPPGCGPHGSTGTKGLRPASVALLVLNGKQLRFGTDTGRGRTPTAPDGHGWGLPTPRACAQPQCAPSLVRLSAVLPVTATARGTLYVKCADTGEFATCLRSWFPAPAPLCAACSVPRFPAFLSSSNHWRSVPRWCVSAGQGLNLRPGSWLGSLLLSHDGNSLFVISWALVIPAFLENFLHVVSAPFPSRGLNPMSLPDQAGGAAWALLSVASPCASL